LGNNPHDEYELASWQCDFGDVVLVTCQFGLGDVDTANW
jgi:hypothetical protein